MSRLSNIFKKVFPAEVSEEDCRRTQFAPLEYSPQSWNKFRATANCLTYALNIPNHGWALAGQLRREYNKKRPSFKFSLPAEKIVDKLESDGLIQVDKADVDLDSQHLIALVCKEKKYYHFYRYDSLSEGWSHKMGENIVTNLDWSDNVIMSPETCNHGPLGSFVSYFTLPEEGILYCPNEDEVRIVRANSEMDMYDLY